MVNVTLESLQNSKEDLIKIINTFIETGKKLTTKYKEMGKFWHDKKYVKVSEEIESCLIILLDSTKRLQDTVKFLDDLSLKVSKYQAQKVGDYSNSFISSLSSMTNTNSNYNPDLYRCGDIKVNEGAENISLNYRNMIDDRIARADSKAKQVYKTYMRKVVIQSAIFTGPAGYHLNDGFAAGIYYDYTKDINGNLFFTYVGQMIEEKVKNYSRNLNFENSLLREISSYNGSNRRIKNLLLHSSDIGKMAFPVFFSAVMGDTDTLNEIRNNLPNSYRLFADIMDNIINHERDERML